MYICPDFIEHTFDIEHTFVEHTFVEHQFDHTYIISQLKEVKTLTDTLNSIISFGIIAVMEDDITMINDICEHPEYSTENDLEGILFDYRIKIDALREMSRRINSIIYDYDKYLKSDLQRKCDKFKSDREKFSQLKTRSTNVYGRAINTENDFNYPSSTCNADNTDDYKSIFKLSEDDDDINVFNKEG